MKAFISAALVLALALGMSPPADAQENTEAAEEPTAFEAISEEDMEIIKYMEMLENMDMLMESDIEMLHNLDIFLTSS